MTTKPSEAAKRKAQELYQQALFDGDCQGPLIHVLARVLQEHSDKAKRVRDAISSASPYVIYGGDALESLILPDDPDPLVDVCGDIGLGASKTAASELREALAKRGLKIVEASDTAKSPQDAR